MRKVVFFNLLVSSLFLFLFAGLLSAQNNRATITGTVLDSTGALVPGARAVATNSETAISASSESNGSGIYSILNLPPGIYSLSIKKEGFKGVEFSKITLIVAQVAELNATLDVGRVNDTVTVTTDAPVLETETSSVGTNMNGSVVTDLPLSIYGGRTVEAFALALTPGYSPSSSPYLAVINGTQGFTKEFTVDGTSGTSQIQGDSMEVGPSMESVEELQAETSGVSAKNASTNGGVVMFNLKSGTNRFHGTAFGYGHNEFLDANGFNNDHLKNLCQAGFTDDARGPCGQYNKVESRFWDYGFSAGGPIIKDKTFVFGAFERFTQNDFRMGNFDSTVPTPDFLQGDFSALFGQTPVVLGTDVHGNTIYKGAIFNPNDPGAVFAGNIIPSNLINPMSAKIVALYQKYYAPQQSLIVGNNRSPASNSPAQTPNQVVIKLDHSFTQNDKVSGSWVYNHRPRTLIDSGGVWQDGTTDGGPFSNSRFQLVLSDEYRVSESHTFSPNVLNVFNATYNWYSNGSTPSNNATNWSQELGFGDTGVNNFPSISFGNTVNGNYETTIGNGWQGDYSGGTFIYGDQLSWTKGRHTMTFGGDFRAMQINSHSGSGALNFNFSNNQTGAPTTSFGNEVGFGFASFLLGTVQNASETTPFNLYGRRKALSLYAQDDFKVTHKLTLNLGLRWDATFRFHEKYGHWASFNLDAIDPNLGIPGSVEYAKNGSDSFERFQDWKNFGPQIGFAYNPWEKVVFRGAFGVTYVPIGIQYWQGVPYGYDPGYRANNIAGNFDWNQAYPGITVPGVKSTTPDNSSYAIPSIDPHALNAGYTDNFNLGAQFEVTKGTKVEVTYVGNRGHRLQDSGLYYNEPSPNKFFNLYNSGHFYDYIYDEPSAEAAGVKYPYAGFSDLAFNALAPFPQIETNSFNYWGAPNLYVEGFNHGQSYYNSLILEVSKRMGKGLSMEFNYTLSKQQGDTNTNFGDSYSVGYIQDFTNLPKEAKTLSVYDQTHVVKGYAVYQLPFGHGHAVLGGAGHFLNALVSGWSVSGLVGYASGLPLGFTSTNYYGYPAWSATYVNFTPAALEGRKFDGSQYVQPLEGFQTPAQDLYFSPAAAVNPTAGTLGNGPARISALRGFGSASEDASLLKYIHMGSDGRYTLSLRVEFYNIFNRHSFEGPNTNLDDARFGYVTGAGGDSRQGQFGARFQW